MIVVADGGEGIDDETAQGLFEPFTRGTSGRRNPQSSGLGLAVSHRLGDSMCEWVRRLWSWPAPGGRLMLGAYRSHSRSVAPTNVTSMLTECGLEVVGSSSGGEEPITRFAWTDGQRAGLPA
jgi:hypothetical protein